MRVESDFFHDHKIEWRNRNFGHIFFLTSDSIAIFAHFAHFQFLSLVFQLF
jgi:hypothetical protein